MNKTCESRDPHGNERVGFPAKVVFFDVGQTLVESPSPPARRFLGSLLGLSEKEIKAVGKLIMTSPVYEPEQLVAPLHTILPARSSSEIRAALGILWRTQAESMRVKEGACALLSSLRAKGLQIGVISNMWHPSFEGLRRSFEELTELVDHWVLSYSVGCKKPSPEIFREALRMAAVDAERCWMVGDSYELDIRPARDLGMRCMWVLSGPEREPDALARVLNGQTPAPHWTVTGLRGIEEYFVCRRRK